MHIRHVNCLIMDSSKDEYLLGKPTLASLGIDVDAQFAQLAGGDVCLDTAEQY